MGDREEQHLQRDLNSTNLRSHSPRVGPKPLPHGREVAVLRTGYSRIGVLPGQVQDRRAERTTHLEMYTIVELDVEKIGGLLLKISILSNYKELRLKIHSSNVLWRWTGD